MGASLTYVTVRSFPVFQPRAIAVNAIFSLALLVHDISQIPGFLPLRLECTDTEMVAAIHILEPHPWASPRCFLCSGRPWQLLHVSVRVLFLSITSKIVYDIMIKK